MFLYQLKLILHKMTTKIFLTGATGYIGGSVLTTLLEYPHKYKISALVRNPEQAELLKKLGVTPVIGSLEDNDLLAKHAEESNAVINTADADHLPSTQALVRGLNAKQTKSTVFLHTSGTGLLTFSAALSKHPMMMKISKEFTISQSQLHTKRLTRGYLKIQMISQSRSLRHRLSMELEQALPEKYPLNFLI
eukprot:TRINITY_DN3698_c0_g1_i1.p1 TRINITY_DN3698_c0_g1~~TRINITY_DN3698_c0_g1_i1.p1  ORF type:complete len:192 (+),score=26.58 TRINITY_DN3698_c0_g1_i1:221-796(+)